MACFWRKDKRKGKFSPPPASQAAGLGMLIQENSHKPWVEDALPQQPAVGDTEKEFANFSWFQRLGKGWRLSRDQRLLWHMAQLKNGSKQCRTFQGAKESQRATRLQTQAAERCTELEQKALGLLEKPGTCQKATRGGEAQQEEHMASVTAVNICSSIPHLREDGWDEPIVGRKVQDGVVVRGGDGHRDQVGQTQPLVQAGTSGDEEGRTTGSPQSLGLWAEDKDAATVPRGDRDRQDLNPSSAEGMSGEEQRRQVWEKLHCLGEDMVEWEGRSTRDLAVRLMEKILKTKTEAYPTEMGNKTHQQEQGQGVARARVGGSKEVNALVDTHVDITTVQQYPQLLYLAVCHDTPVSISGTTYGDDQHLPAMPEPSGNEQIWEHSDDDLEQGGSPALPRPAVLACHVKVVEVEDKEQWREEFPYVWARYEMDCGLVSGEENVSGAPVPFQWQPPLPDDTDEAVANMLQYLLADGVVVKGTSSSNSPLHPIPKGDGKTWRLTLNCKAINKATPMVEAPVVLNRTTLVATISPKSKYFSVVDLSNSSFAIPLAADSRARFAFTFRGQQYLFTRLPQGFHSTTSIVHRRVAQMLLQLPRGDQPWVFSYVDDILITGRSPKETRARTKTVLKLIQKTGFKAKFEKVQLVQPKVDYLGMTIGAEGREIQASKLEAISKAPCPRDVHSLRSLLGQFISLQDHIADFWELARPLHHLTTEQVAWEWGPKQEQELSRLKHAILTAPTLRFPDKSQTFIIRLTTSKEAIGASLLQEDKQGRLVPVGHSSRILKSHEASYLPQEKGCLAAIWAVQAFETLTGLAPIVIQMPHSPWKYLVWGEALESCGTNPYPAQWTLLLVNTGAMAKSPQPECRYPPSTPVPTAPPLRLLPSHVPKANVWFMASDNTDSISFAAANLEERWLLGVAQGSSMLDAELEALKQLLYSHQRSSPLYLYTSCWSLVEELQSQIGEWESGSWASSGEGLWPSILQWVHTNPGMLHIRCMGGDRSKDLEEKEWSQKVGRRARAMSGRAVGSCHIWEPSKHEKQEIIARCHYWSHEGAEGTLARVRQVALWEGDSEQVARWVRSCLLCAAGRNEVGRVLPQRAEGPWSQLQLGYISGLPETKEGYHSLLVVEDEFSGWVEAFPVWEKTAEETVKVLFEEIFTRYGTPRAIRLLHVPCFLQDAVQLVMEACSVELLCDLLQPSQVGPASAALQQLALGAGREWVKMLPLILAGFRSVRARGEVLSPYQIIFGFPLEMKRGCEEEVCPQDNVLPWLRQLQEDGTSYKHWTEGMLPKDCEEGDAPWL
ncbi:uncharacterized protein LOC121090492 [Falco naumanni]|uniref:uncharacterized protein LOC121090492 n=1 Tax=Falco naumanni TaxID=148594 RepID=UPI001ADE442B|nr:uncharacterized protein LOC121090492 [Falco naumanni]